MPVPRASESLVRDYRVWQQHSLFCVCMNDGRPKCRAQ